MVREIAAKQDLDSFSLSLAYFLVILLRQKSKKNIPEFFKKLEQSLSEETCASFLLQNASNKEFFREFLIDCPVEDMSYLVMSLLTKAFGVLSKREEKHRRVIDGYLVTLYYLLDTFIPYYKNSKFVGILLSKAMQQKTACNYFSRLDFQKFGEYLVSCEFYSHQGTFSFPQAEDRTCFIARPREQTKSLFIKEDYSYYLLQIYFKFLLNMGPSHYQNYHLFKERKFWNQLLVYQSDRRTLKLQSEFFVIVHGRAPNFIYSFLEQLQPSLSNYFSLFFLFAELINIKDEMLSELVFNSLSQMSNSNLMKNFFFFDDLFYFVHEQFVTKKQFREVIVKRGEHLMQRLGSFN